MIPEKIVAVGLVYKIRFISFLIICLLSSAPVLAQQDLNLLFSLDGGIPMNRYGNSRDGLNAAFLSYQINYAMSLQYCPVKYFGIEAGIQQSFQKNVLEDANFAGRNQGFKAAIRNSNHYFTWFGALTGHLPINNQITLYLSGGFAGNIVGSQSVQGADLYINGRESLSLISNYLGSNNGLIGEGGIKLLRNDKHPVYVGLKMHYGLSDFMTSDYEASSDNTILYQDKFMSAGTYMGLTLRYGFNIWHKDPTPRVQRIEPQKTIPPVRPSIPPVPPKDVPGTIEGRTTNVTHKVAVKNPKVTIRVWDHEIIDGDIISLNFNGNWILSNYSLVAKQKVIVLDLKPGINYLVLHAHNLGKYSPNTAAIIVEDGATQTKIVLESTLQSSGTIELNLGQ